jgi:hypothetical protein
MPDNRLRRSNGSRSRARGKVVAVLLAAVWLMLLAVLGAHSASAAASNTASVHAHAATPIGCPTGTPTPPASSCTATPTATNTPIKLPTLTPTIGLTTPTASVTTTATVAPTATTATGGGGGGGGGNPNDPGSGGQATKVVLAQPTYGASTDTSGEGISVASFGSNGLLFASLMSCIVGLLGIVVAVIAVRILRRDGYGPFLRALLLGKRADRQPRAEGAVAASNAGNARRAAWNTEDVDDLSGERQSYSGYGTRAPPSGAGRRPPSRPNAPRSRSSRPDW